MDYIEALERRYSVKRFDESRKIPQDQLDSILEAGKLSASSLGLQPYKIWVIENPEIKEKLIPAFYNPSQISTCSHLIVLVTKKTIEHNYVDGYFRHIEEVRNVTTQSLELFRNSIDTFVHQMKNESTEQWAEKQAYIVLGTLMMAAAQEGVDTCPMEGFRSEIVSSVLNLDTKTEKVSVTLALGYRSPEDHFQNLKKVRKPNEKLYKFL